MPLMSISMASGISEDAVRIESAFSFSDTLARLQSTLESRGFRIFAAIAHRAAAESVGLTMPPTTVLIYGNPKGGTPLMLAAPDFALELPLRVLVRGGPEGKAYVTYNPSTTLGGKYPGKPRASSADPDVPVSHRDRVYSTEQFSNTVSVVDPVDNKLLGVIRLGDP